MVSKEPEDEYDGLPIFSNAFPWLFPGGIGDINCNKKKEFGYVQKWASIMVHYFDGRFVKDGTWCFYALNYLQRHQNNISGGFFVRDFIKCNRPSDVTELKKQVQGGDYSFIDKLIYFSSKIRGSDSYWRLKKSQLYTWVYWHIEQGHGPPTLFITLSCAEYYWPDIRRLMEDRIRLTGIDEYKNNNNKSEILSTKAEYMKSVNHYSIVVQEYFITRVKDWMETFAKKVLGVTNYFVRFEFAKGRGETHAHILAIADNSDVFLAAYNSVDANQKLDIISTYAQTVLGLTSDHPEIDMSITTAYCPQDDNAELLSNPPTDKNKALRKSPASTRLSNVGDHHQDKIALCNSSQMHKCGSYCMKYSSRSKDKKSRYCRAGCGYEKSSGCCDTPGFQILDFNII
jgi:hypothetical protein